MKKIFLLFLIVLIFSFICLFTFGPSKAQNKSSNEDQAQRSSALSSQQDNKLKQVPEMIRKSKAARVAFERRDLFQAAAKVIDNDQQLREVLSDGITFDLDKPATERILQENAVSLTLSLPDSNGGTVELELVRVDIFAPGFTVKTSKPTAERIDESLGVHYRGIVKGNDRSLAAISIFKNEVTGFYSTEADGNFVLGRLGGDNPIDKHVLYAEKDLKVSSEFSCDTKDPEVTLPTSSVLQAPEAVVANCVRIYIEADYSLFQNKGSVANTTSYLTSMFNQSATLFSNDGIPVSTSEILVWNSPSPYNGADSDAVLDQFIATRTSFNGDLAHLVTLNREFGGIAYLDSLCDTGSRYAVSDIDSTFSNVPTYSWTVEVFTHETGHNLGSPHTHACAWNGNNTAIDGCGAPEGNCSRPGMPSGGGTIMSYCHQQSVGINFTLGFGPQPRNLIVNRFNAATCLSGCGSTNYTISVSASPSAGGTVSGGGTFAAGSSRTVTASANNGYTFTNWTENGSVVSSSASYSFTLNSNRTLIANFTSVSTGNAVYDSTLKAPKCGQPGSACDSGTLLNGRDTITGGQEPNQPNTIYNSCADNTTGSYHVDESIDRIKVSTLDGSNFAPGKTVKIEATVWAFSTTDDFLDLFYAADATNPNWTYIGTLRPPGTGAQVLSTTYTLPSGGNLQAVRANFLYQGGATPCNGGASNYDDHDDLIFAASSSTTRTLTVASSNPASGVSITVSPNDNSGSGSGTTQFTRTYNNNTSVNLTAPSTAGGNSFQKWQRDGQDFSTNRSISVTMDADHTVTAIYVANQLAQITSPANGSTFTSSTMTFNWSTVANATQYFLDLNSSPGSRDIFADYASNGVTTVSGIPTDGRTIYVRMWSYIGGVWAYNDYSYKACNGCGSGAVITSPANGSTFTSPTVTFTWNPVPGANEYYLDLNSSPGSRDIYADYVSGGSTTVFGIPTDGRTIYVRMWSYIGGVWFHNAYSYKACNGCSGVNPNIAQITSPANGSTFTSSTMTFNWSTVANATQYFLDLNSSPGSRDIFADYVSGVSKTISGIPNDGRTIYVRMWSLIGGAWFYNSYTYKACNGCAGINTSIAQITSPANNSTFASSTVTFTWNTVAGASQYFLDLNSSPGSRDIFADYVSGGSTTVSGIPTDGRTIYVRMWTNMGGVWLYNTYTYTARH